MKTAKKTEDQNYKTIQELKKHKENFEPRWYICSAFYDGHHFSWGKQDKDGNFVQTPQPRGQVIRQIPKAKKHINSIRNMLLKIRLKPVAYPDKNVLYSLAKENADPEMIKKEEEAAKKMASYVDNELMENMKLLNHRKKLIRYAELMGHSFIQLLNEGDKLKLEVGDAFDYSVPVGTSVVEDRIVKHVSTTLDKIKANKDYDQKAVKEAEAAMEANYSGSKYKNAMMTEKYGKASDENIILDELYLLEDGKMNIYTYLGDKLLRTQNTGLTKIPISIFVWEDEAYQTSLMEDLMPLNRAYDMFISKLEHKVKKVDTARIITQKGENIKRVTTKEGEIIRYKRFRPNVMEESQVSQAFFSIIGIVEQDLKEQGVAMATGGDVPTGVKAWRAIESLKESDYASIGNQINNLEETFTDITEKLVCILASKIDTVDVAQIPNGDGSSEVYGVIGADHAEGREIDEDVVKIDPNTNIKIEMESTVGWTENGRRDIIIELIQAGLLPQETAIQMLEIGNTKDIIKKLNFEASKGQSMIDSPDFKLLPKELQVMIVRYLNSGGVINDPEARPEDMEGVAEVGRQ